MPKTDRVGVTWTLSARVTAKELQAIDLLIATLLAAKSNVISSPSTIEVERQTEAEVPIPPKPEEFSPRKLLMMCNEVRVFLDRWQSRFPKGDGKQTGYRKICRLLHHYGVVYIGDLLLLTDEQLYVVKNIGVKTLKKIPIVLNDLGVWRGPSPTLEVFASWRQLQAAVAGT